ncbi:MAG: metallophosphoesterase [Candidatus Melainabacteria bacterium]|nr:metallophosphoesterase [Candidatus Melainabacteria bacterium]
MSFKNCVIQISDPHLFGDKNRKINGANSYLNLKKVFDNISKLTLKPNLLILSGDLSQDCTFESYQHLANLLNKSGIKYCIFPGNHDDVDVINKVFDYNWIKNSVDYCIELGNWFLYIIDSSVYPEDSGSLSEKQLLNLENILKINKNKSTVIFTHHHPIKINSSWMDKMMLKEAKHFNDIVLKNKQIKAVLFGHIHQVFEKQESDLLYASSPSTAYQVRSDCNEFIVDKTIPGYRIIQLDEDNEDKGEKLISKIIWVE